MSITPFLPGLPVPVPADAATPADGSGDPTGDPGAVFGDALAAALLATVPLPTTPVAVPTTPVAAAPATAPLVSAAVAPVIAPASPTPEPDAGPAVEVQRPLRPDLPAPSLDTTGPAADDGAAADVPPEPAGTPRPVAAPHPTSHSEEAATAAPVTNLPAASLDVSTLLAGTPRTSTTGAATVERAVVQQVFPEVTRLVASTPTDRPGTHRITLTLQPEQLGEVRVTLVVKDGAVQVRLAGNAGDAAGNAAVHRALSSGVPELQRLLERSGAVEARVLVRDPAGPTPALQPTAPVAATNQPGGSTVSADAGREGASAWNRSSGDPDQRRQRRDVPEPPPLAPVPTLTTPSTSPSGQLDRTL